MFCTDEKFIDAIWSGGKNKTIISLCNVKDNKQKIRYVRFVSSKQATLGQNYILNENHLEI